MAITAGRPGSLPIDLGVSEWLSRKLQRPVWKDNPLQTGQILGTESIQNYPGMPVTTGQRLLEVQGPKGAPAGWGSAPEPSPTPDSFRTNIPNGFDGNPQSPDKGILEGWFNYYNNLADNMRSEGERGFSGLMENLKSFRDRSRGLYDTANQEIINRSNDLLYSNARTGQEAQGMARSMGRGLGLSDSSKMNRNDRAVAQLASAQGDVLARRGENERTNQATLDERIDAADAEERRGRSTLENIIAQAQAMRQAGVQSALENYEGRINNMRQQAQQMAAMGLNPNTLTSIDANFSGLGNNFVEAINQANQGTANQGPQMGNMVNNNTLADILRRYQGLVQ